jgi:membrane protein CcdC involved in cytochrome C biogenesis
MNAPFASSLVLSLVGFLTILAWRIRETHSPLTLRKIVAPPMGMSTGLCMFAAPAFRVPWPWALVSVSLGATILAYPLLRTTDLHADPTTGTLKMKRSPAFFFVFVGVALLRFIARAWISQLVSVPQTAALFFLLAYGMILRWRFAMARQFCRLSPIHGD